MCYAFCPPLNKEERMKQLVLQLNQVRKGVSLPLRKLSMFWRCRSKRTVWFLLPTLLSWSPAKNPSAQCHQPTEQDFSCFRSKYKLNSLIKEWRDASSCSREQALDRLSTQLFYWILSGSTVELLQIGRSCAAPGSRSQCQEASARELATAILN